MQQWLSADWRNEMAAVQSLPKSLHSILACLILDQFLVCY